jgi:hypothetical protein
MSLKLNTPEARAAIKSESFGMNGIGGGPQKKTYYTPDGRIIETFPMIRDYVKKNAEGKVIAQGQRDANLDKGWLTEMPKVKALFCQSCTRWHDTKAQVAECKRKQEAFEKIALNKAKKEESQKAKSQDERIAALEAQIARLTGGQSGALLQSTGNEQNGKITRRNGNTAKGIQQ